MNSVTDNQSGGYGRNIDNSTGGNPHGPIGTITPETNSSSNCNTFDYIISNLYLTYRGFSWDGAVKSERENLGGNNMFENAEHENYF